MTTSPQDDLTAERAAIIGEHYECEDSWYSCPVSDEGCVNPGAGEECTCGVDTRRILLDKLLKTARQEALRELRTRLEKREQFYTEQEAQSEGQIRLTRGLQRNEASGCIAELDRLANEGAPASIDLLPKLTDDGGYGEHF